MDGHNNLDAVWCENCAYFDFSDFAVSSGKGSCTRYPPTFDGRRPVVKDTDSCGEFLRMTDDCPGLPPPMERIALAVEAISGSLKPPRCEACEPFDEMDIPPEPSDEQIERMISHHECARPATSSLERHKAWLVAREGRAGGGNNRLLCSLKEAEAVALKRATAYPGVNFVIYEAVGLVCADESPITGSVRDIDTSEVRRVEAMRS